MEIKSIFVDSVDPWSWVTYKNQLKLDINGKPSFWNLNDKLSYRLKGGNVHFLMF